MMGEMVTDEEVDLMIGMLDIHGDGQVSFNAFKRMVESEDPANEDFLSAASPTRSNESFYAQQRNEQAEKKREAFSRCVRTCKIDRDDVLGMWTLVRQRVRESTSPSKSIPVECFYLGYEGILTLLPAAFCSAAEVRVLFDLLRNGDEQMIDSRALIMSFTNFVAGFGLEEKCRLAFEMFDVDRSGYLSLDEIEAMMISTNLATHDLIKRRAENFMLCADTDRYFEMCTLLSCEICNIFTLSIFCFCRCLYCRSGGITIDELIVAAEKLPNLIFPSQTKKY